MSDLLFFPLAAFVVTSATFPQPPAVYSQDQRNVVDVSHPARCTAVTKNAAGLMPTVDARTRRRLALRAARERVCR
jgi:hypothetical protein